MELARKLSILADAAKYDASCASSGSARRHSRTGGLGSTTGSGICHSYTPDGRCVSLLKLLLTNYCTFDCLYCVNRASSNVPRARFTVGEVVDLTLDFYRRNYIEGLFLSSGIIRDPDYTMEQVVAVARSLRQDHGFKGYIHLKTIPEAAPELIEEAGRLADRISINVELPRREDLAEYAPQKDLDRISRMMGTIRRRIDEGRPVRAARTRPPAFAPAGQSTQMVVGATLATDADVLQRADSLYRQHRLRRVYYSAFSPIPEASRKLPLVAPPLVREHRLYQADWLMRFYGFEVGEIVDAAAPALRLDVDPKHAWALRHPALFPVDANRASREMLLRVPGLGVRNVDRMLAIRRWGRLSIADLARLKVSLKKALPFLILSDHRPRIVGAPALPETTPRAPNWEQLDLFAGVVGGQL